MNTISHIDDPFMSDHMLESVKDARESIISLPSELQRPAFEALVAILEHEIPPPQYSAARTTRRFSRRSSRSYHRN